MRLYLPLRRQQSYKYCCVDSGHASHGPYLQLAVAYFAARKKGSLQSCKPQELAALLSHNYHVKEQRPAHVAPQKYSIFLMPQCPPIRRLLSKAILHMQWFTFVMTAFWLQWHV